MKKLLITFAIFTATLLAQHEVSVNAGLAIPRHPVAAKPTAGAGYAYKFRDVYSNGFQKWDQFTMTYTYTALTGVPLQSGHVGAHTALFGYKHNWRSSINRIGVFYSGAGGFTRLTTANASNSLTGQFGGGLLCDLSDVYPGISVTLGFYGNKIATVPLFFSTAFGVSKSF